MAEIVDFRPADPRTPYERNRDRWVAVATCASSIACHPHPELRQTFAMIALRAFADAPDRQPDIADTDHMSLFAVKLLLQVLAAEPETTIELGSQSWDALSAALRNRDR